jgi:hypothetical protein
MVSLASEYEWRVSETFRNTETFLGGVGFPFPACALLGRMTGVKEQREGSNFASTKPVSEMLIAIARMFADFENQG